MAASDKSSWPKTPGGTTDWEKVFEDPQIGFIPLIAKAPTAKALRESAIVVIKQLFTRKDDPPEVEHFVGEITKMVPDNFPEDKLPLVVQAVSDILRQVKEERKRKAAEYEAEKAQEAAEEAEAAKNPSKPKKKKRKKDRRSPEKAMRAAAKKRAAQEKRAKLIRAAGIALIVIGAAGGGFLLWKSGALEKPKIPSELLVDEIYRVNDGEPLEVHHFGGPIKAHTFQGRKAVTVEKVPPDDCSSAAWQLVNRGSIMINNRMPRKVSPSVLNELCNFYRQGATITWFPKEKKKREKAF